MTATAGLSAKRGAGRAPRVPAAARRPARKPPAALVEQAARNTLAANPLIGFGRKDVSAAATALLGQLARRPGVVTKRYASFMGELARVAAGRSTLGAQPGDRRFADRAWSDSAVFRRLLQAHVALGDSLNRCVDEAGMDARNADRARFAVSLFVDALAPTNFLAGNPAALRKLADTKGVSVIRGFANFVEDLASGRGLPRQVDARPFTVGKNVATTPGAVVFRNELLELIQYAPATPSRARAPALDRAAADQQVLRLRPRPGEQPRALVARRRRADLRRELAKPDARARGVRARRVRRGARAGGRRDARSEWLCRRQRVRRVLRRDHADGAPRLARGRRPAQGQERDARRVRARHGGRAGHDRQPVRDAGDDRRGASLLAQAGRARRQGARAHVRVDAAQRPRLELRRQQLPAGQRSARARHPVLEQRHDAAARRDCTPTSSRCTRRIRFPVRARCACAGARSTPRRSAWTPT